jgi:tetratricopeptide (TPR) repeat protein
MAASKNKLQTKPAPRWRFWLPRIAFAIVAPILLLALTEGALRLFHVGYSTDLMEPCTIHGRTSSCYNLFFAAPFFPPGMIKTPQFFSIDPVKPQNTYRIVILGESAAMGDPDFAYGFGRYLEVMLRQRFPGIKFEVINTGIVAINSHVIRSIARQITIYQPDLLIVYAGNNEVVGPYGPGSALTSSSPALPVVRASIFVRSSRLGQIVTQTGSPRSEWRGMEMFLDKQVRADSPTLQRTYKNFESNLKEIVAAGIGSGARVLLSTVATNLRDSAPFGSLHRPGLTPDALKSWSARVQHGNELEASQSFAEALKLYYSAAQIDDEYAELAFRIARCESALGDYAAAKDHYTRARDLDTLRFRADSRINEIIRATAKTSVGDAVLLDTDSLFAGESRNDVIGSELFYDHVHLTPLASYLLAGSVFQQVVKALPQEASKGSQSTEPPSELECERLLAFTGHDRARVAAEMADRMQRPPFTKQLNHAEQLQNLMLRAAGPAESPQDTFAQYQWAIAQYPSDLALHYKFGFFLFDYDRNAAAQQLLLARPTDNFPVFLPDGSQIQ